MPVVYLLTSVLSITLSSNAIIQSGGILLPEQYYAYRMVTTFHTYGKIDFRKILKFHMNLISKVKKLIKPPFK